MGKLFVVATPIGNLEDISARSIKTLEVVDKIYAEDTRRTGQLLKHFEIQTPLQSYFEYNELKRIPEILQELTMQDLALVSDAGTPTISDPGFKLVREVAKSGFEIVVVPGSNAALAALVSSGLPTNRFTFMGFLPKKESAARKVLEEVKDWRTTLIFYESPFRVEKTLRLLIGVLGDRKAAVARELTKTHEETVRGKISEILKGGVINKGEFVIVVGDLKDD
jgi:16S rRNA (cytidine1402-2'-O)-methyltransferase